MARHAGKLTVGRVCIDSGYDVVVEMVMRAANNADRGIPGRSVAGSRDHEPVDRFLIRRCCYRLFHFVCKRHDRLPEPKGSDVPC